MRSVVVSIGMPVRNEERFLAQALDSLLSQDFTDFEIIISDNASTDNTQKIALKYAQKDSRIRYFRNEKNIGFAGNFNQVFYLSFSKYFMWASGNDLWEPTFISSCLKVLEENSDVVLSCTLIKRIGNDGKLFKAINVINDTRNLNPLLRVHRLLYCIIQINPFYSLIRSETIKKTLLYQKVLNADIIFLTQLSLLGSFVCVPYFLFSYRLHHLLRNAKQIREVYIKYLYDANSQNYPIFAYYFHMLYIFTTTIFRTPISWYLKPLAFFLVILELLLLKAKVIVKRL